MMDRPATDLISKNYAGGKQTFILPLAVGDIASLEQSLERISYGGDIWELRADLLKDATNQKPSCIPSQGYVASQLQLLRKASSLPVIFTIRTVAQGGKFPENATREARDLMMLAILQGCEYIDVGYTWPPDLIREIVAYKGGSKIVASYHDSSDTQSWKDIWQVKKPLVQRYGGTFVITTSIFKLTDCRHLEAQHFFRWSSRLSSHSS